MNKPVESRALIVCLGLVLGLSCLSARLIHLQWFDRKETQAKATKIYERELRLPAERGLIVDRNEDVLAWNLPVTSIKVDKYHLKDPKTAAFGVAYARLSGQAEFEEAEAPKRRRMIFSERSYLLDTMRPQDIVDSHFKHAVAVMSRHLRMPKAELREKIEGSSLMDITLAKDLREDVAGDLEQAVRDNYVQGFRFEKNARRWYPASKLATHTVGFVNHDGIGQCGVEKSVEKYLQGKDGYRILKRDPRGLLLAPNEGKLKPPRAGLSVQVTLDMGLQMIVEEELDAALNLYQAEKGSIILIEPKTGDVLAIASRPHFDLNLKEGIAEGSFNYAVQAIYEPGSTFKVVATSAALDLGLVNPRTPIFCHHAHLQEKGFVVKDHHPYGMLTFEQILAKSSNIGAFKLAKQVGVRRFVKSLKDFGFTQRSGISLASESRGMLADPGNDVNFSTMSYGYGVSVTPIQVAMAYSAVANGGVLMKPRLVKSVIANDGTIMEQFDPEVRGRVMKKSTSRLMRHALATVIDPKGTARRGKVPGFKGAGKTGTARKVKKTGGYYEDRYVVSFAGMLPVKDPAFVCVVVIDDPQTTDVPRGGGTIAAPVFAKVAGRAASYWNLTPTEPIEESEGKILAASSGN